MLTLLYYLGEADSALPYQYYRRRKKFCKPVIEMLDSFSKIQNIWESLVIKISKMVRKLNSLNMNLYKLCGKL